MNSISIRDLTVTYGEKPVLWDIDLDLPEGQLCAIIGPNGAGKSTLLKAILGLVPVSSGTWTIAGKKLPSALMHVGYVPQRSEVDWDFPTDVLDVVLMGTYRKLGWFRRPGREQHDLAVEALEKVGMLEFQHRQISQLSGGQRQRVFLARALAQQSPITLMDEPFAGVDAVTERSIIDVLRQMRSEGQTVIVVHHDLDRVKAIFDHVTLLNTKVVATGPLEEAFIESNLRHTYGARSVLVEERA
ncbi:metal ABC transporter ATP-binding protein [Kamptonema cortianum]|nr:metal ABC transporter ATP-binding protein [Geitlerinema splendidum]MDK3155288.1 metal ABC transporter ATP-binding protein [Kamptonema cortianum]